MQYNDAVQPNAIYHIRTNGNFNAKFDLAEWSVPVATTQNKQTGVTTCYSA